MEVIIILVSFIIIISIIYIIFYHSKVKYIIPGAFAIICIYWVIKANNSWDLLHAFLIGLAFVTALLPCIIIDIREFIKKEELTNHVKKHLQEKYNQEFDITLTLVKMDKKYRYTTKYLYENHFHNLVVWQNSDDETIIEEIKEDRDGSKRNN